MQNRDLHNFFLGMNKDDRPEDLKPGEIIDALNLRLASSKDQNNSGLVESLQAEIPIDISGSAIYYGNAIGGSFVYSGYEECQIGTQVWMKKNWDAEYPGSKVYDDDENNRAVYGGLYTHDQIIASDFCPEGWHIPTEAEIDTLIAYLLGDAVAGGKMKEPDDLHWLLPNTGADDKSGFKGLPGGGFGFDLTYYGTPIGSDFVYDLLGEMGLFWLADDAPDLSVVTDKDGNDYNVITIGSQQWLVENLKTTKYADGSAIPNITLAGYTDWFLPSKDELNEMYEELYLHGVGITVGQSYATSSEVDANNYWYQFFGTGVQISAAKGTFVYVRACRAFNTTTVYNLRDIGPAGGYIFWKSGNDYLEAAPADIATQNRFSNIENVAIGTTGTAIGTGQANTTAIIGQVGHTMSAAKLCDDLVAGGWVSDITGAYCWYDNDIANKTDYGALYNWHAVNNAKGLAVGQFTQEGSPSLGWRVPNYDDFDALKTFLGGDAVAGGKLKEMGLTHWLTPNTGASDIYGFKALPGGQRDPFDGSFLNIGEQSTLWSSTDYDGNNAYATQVALYDSIISDINDNALYGQGLSVRCMRDL